MSIRNNKFKVGQIWKRTFSDAVMYQIVSCNKGKNTYADFDPRMCKRCTINSMLLPPKCNLGFCCRLQVNNTHIKKLTKLEALLENF